MENHQRILTGPFEPGRRPPPPPPATGGPRENIRLKSTERRPPPIVIPPALHISPPQGETDLEDDSNKSDKLESPMARLFKTHIVGKASKRRPKLSLRTTSFNSSRSNDDDNLKTGKSAVSQNIFGDASGLSTASPNRKRGRSLRKPSASTSKDSKSRSRSRSVSIGSTDRAPRSAKVLSLIAADDMDEFQDIQNEFRNVTDEKGLKWLPSLNKQDDEEEDQETETGRFFTEQEDRYFLYPTTPGIASNKDTFFRNPIKAQPENNVLETNSEWNEQWEGMSSINNNLKSVFDDDDLHTKNDDVMESTLSIALPDFDEPVKKAREPLKLYGNSLGVIPPDNRIRLVLAELHERSWFKTLYLFLLTFFTVLLAYRTYNPKNVDFLYRFNNWSDYINFILFILFTINDVTKIVAFGFWDDSDMFAAYGKEYRSLLERFGIVKLYESLTRKYGATLIDSILPFKIHTAVERKHLQETMRNRVADQKTPGDKKDRFQIPRAFARSSWNRIDLVSTSCFWIGMFVSIKNYDKRVGIRIFKPLAVLRILRLVNTDTGISSILRALKYGIPQLINVGSMMVYFWVFFGILGVQIFQGSLRRHCVWVNPSDPADRYQYNMQFCGGHLEPETKQRMNYVFEDGSNGPVSKGFLCPPYSKCISNSNPYNGRVSFDNIVNSMELVFVIMSANTFTDLMYYTMDSDEMAACLFFIFCIFVLTIWMMNLLIAVLVSSYDLAHEKYKKKKLERRDDETWVVRLARGYWKYFKVKASSTDFPVWASKGIFWYENFEWIFVVLIITDLVMRACLSDQSSEHDIYRLYMTDRGISIVLFLETLLRMVLYIPNPWRFLLKANYIIDLVISFITLIVSSLAVKGKLGHSYYWLSLFQIFRFYRVVLSISLARQLWQVVLKNGMMIWNLTSFYFFFTFLVAIILSLFFEGVVDPNEMSDEAFAMYSLPNSFLSLFIIGSTENWTSILYTLQQYSPNVSSAFFCSVLLIIWFILSNSVMLNIFIALISGSMEIEESEKRPLQIKHYLKYVYPQKIQEYTHASLIQRIRKKIFGRGEVEDSRDFKQFLIRGTAIMNIAHNMDDLAKEINENSSEKESKQKVVLHWINKVFKFPVLLKRLRFFKNNPFYRKPEVVFTEMNGIDGKTYILQLNEFEDEKLEYLKSHPSFNYSYYIFPPRHRFRRFCQRLVPPSFGKRTDGVRFFEDDTDMYTKRRYFSKIERDLFVFTYAIVTVLLVIVSCFVTPLYRKKNHIRKHDWPLYIDCAFIVLFSLEFIVKTVADGWVYSPNAYTKNPWNLVDFSVLMYMWIYLIAYLKNDGNLSRIFKGLSALRALRCLTISNTARQTFTMVLFKGMKKITEAGVISFTLLFPFTIWGLGLFRGRLGTCNDGSLDRAHCFDEYTNQVFKWDVMMPRTYSQPNLYFDSFPSSLRSLFEIISLEGWVDLLTNLMNSTGVGTATSTLGDPKNAIFMIFFNFLSMVFILNLFVSFIVSNYAKTTGSAYYTAEEKAWLESLKLLSQTKPLAQPNLFELSKSRLFFYHLAVEKKNFYYATFLQIVLYMHIVVLLSISYSHSTALVTFSEVFFMVSTSIFLLQELFQMYGEGIYLYSSHLWNTLRFLILTVSFILTITGFHVHPNHVWFHNLKDFFHLIMFLYVIPQSDMLTELLQTATASLPPILSLTYTWAILFLVYAMALNQIFGLTRLGSNTTDNLNFRTIVKSLIVLFRCSFGEGWNYIMDDLTVAEPFCTTDPTTGYSDCGSRIYAYLLLMSWNVLSMYIFMNMFISLVIGNFSYVYRSGGSHSPVNRTEIKKYVEAWVKYDPDGTGELEFSLLPKLMHSFDGTFSFKVWEGSLTISNLVKHYMTVNPDDPYDVKVDLKGLNLKLNTINKAKILHRRLQYRRFVQETRYTNSYEGAIKFSRLLCLVPLYTTYNPRECLGIDQYVRHLYNMNKVDKYLDNQRNVDVLDMVVTRWKYHLKKKYFHLKIKDGDFMGDDDFANSTLDRRDSTDNLPIETPRMDFGVDNFMWSPDMSRVDQESPDLIQQLSWVDDKKDKEDSKENT
ncbi:calcium channel protein CCH1 KNAG_0G00640 [Huiozyma naganishii CBS 8797]|uniref:Calcium-channel protein CCH1 n=1 Tax=Huiozyma naganishii (strain ATCC MYA-139 / BCRC 22969 / CBS 8797 / KCTC 17520 / NBRC 10181 / NCYC 3082 / Yp74L-3) TaxID=1071383 RepID=J7R8C6_HUIN7|nr:hypothetical protein KNAG_0G00640 [Kazachstania naganishii CBS 8797]CCK71120.1 hypothetical protein KNAG_0G00640 [Kazachstania naganishii CBS 8797]